MSHTWDMARAFLTELIFPSLLVRGSRLPVRRGSRRRRCAAPRRDDLLEAARRLAREHGVRDVTLTSIAAAVGLHKSAVLRYFETREALFLLLGQAPMNLERDVSVEGVRDFKLATMEQVEILSAGIAGALWQISHSVPTVAEFYATEPRLAHAAVDFEPTLRSDAEVIIEGVLRVPADAGSTSAHELPGRREHGLRN
jgi:AcrR family transcriptional regulator